MGSVPAPRSGGAGLPFAGMAERRYARAMPKLGSPRSLWFNSACVLVAAVGLLAFLPAESAGQRVNRISQLLVREVMPEATRFSTAEGDPPVISAYRDAANGSETLSGYVFLTSDLPPEQYGYSGPIEALVGMRPDGTITGIRVTDYRESYMRQMGDFLRDTRGFQEQFAGKHIGDPFRLWGDVEGISRVSISVRALSRGVRDSARRVANAYGVAPALGATEIVDPIGQSWFGLRQLGVVQRFEVTDPGEGSAGIALALIENERMGEYFLGAQLYARSLSSAERRGGAENLLLYAVDGSRLRLFKQEGWTVEQDGLTIPIEPRNVVSMGLPSGGVVSGEATMVGIMLVDGSLDAARPFSIAYDLGELGVHSVDYMSQEARLMQAEAAAALEVAEALAAAVALEAAAAAETAAAAEASAAAASGASAAAEAGDDPSGSIESVRVEDADLDPPGGDEDAGAAALGLDQLPELDFVLTEDETLLERTLSGASWGRVGTMLLVLTLGTAAFLTKIVALRWIALTVTLVLLGFLDGGFLSVSHITSGIWAGAGVYLRDLPLLLIVTFTVVSTLLWGRVFCGFLCPFGALQDLIDRFVPKRLKRPLPQWIHDRAVYAKYGILALIVLPALAGSQVSLYQYFEPFGTVFFMSPSIGLWIIAGAFLTASVVIPRFYCRYACPLGAALGLLSLVSLNRITRVEQCDHCKVCEQKCPTGAIRGPKIDFHECVRCNVCEVQLIEKTGVCQHDMEVIRPRLVQLEVARTVGKAHV